MLSIIRITLAIIFMTFLSSSLFAAERVIKLTETQLQVMLSSMMPYQRSFPVIDISVSNAKVNLFSQTEKIGIDGGVNFSGNGFNFDGRVALSGRVEVDAASSQVFLRDVTIDTMSFNDLPPSLDAIQGVVKFLLEFVAGVALNSFPVYKFDQKDIKQLLVSGTLQDVRVKNDRLEIVLGT